MLFYSLNFIGVKDFEIFQWSLSNAVTKGITVSFYESYEPFICRSDLQIGQSVVGS